MLGKDKEGAVVGECVESDSVADMEVWAERRGGNALAAAGEEEVRAREGGEGEAEEERLARQRAAAEALGAAKAAMSGGGVKGSDVMEVRDEAHLV